MNMKKTLTVTIIVTLLPCLIGLLLWNRLPDQIPTHFDFNNNIDGWSSKPLAVFGIPAILAAMQFFLLFVTGHDPKRQNISPKIISFFMWIIPITSLTVCSMSYSIALGANLNVGAVINGLIGVLFIGIGNYLPKTKPNYTVGIKISWTLNDPENWRKTHRLAGFLWVISGIMFFINMFFLYAWVLFAIIIIATLIPAIYSFLLYRSSQ
ncbi:MAG: SdpI family protein [Lachnospiraceae bacterium]